MTICRINPIQDTEGQIWWLCYIETYFDPLSSPLNSIEVFETRADATAFRYNIGEYHA